MHFYHVVLFYLAGAGVFADRVVAWVSERTGRALGRRYTILFATLNIVVLVLTVLYVERFDPALTWTERSS